MLPRSSLTAACKSKVLCRRIAVEQAKSEPFVHGRSGWLLGTWLLLHMMWRLVISKDWLLCHFVRLCGRLLAPEEFILCVQDVGHFEHVREIFFTILEQMLPFFQTMLSASVAELMHGCRPSGLAWLMISCAPHGARHGKTDAQKEHFVAHNTSPPQLVASTPRRPESSKHQAADCSQSSASARRWCGTCRERLPASLFRAPFDGSSSKPTDMKNPTLCVVRAPAPTLAV